MTTTSDRFAIASDPQPLPQSGSLGPGLAERRPIEGAAAGVGPAGQAHPAPPPPPPPTAWMGGTMDVPPLAPPPQAAMQAPPPPQVQQPVPAPAPVPLPPVQPPAGWHRPGEGLPPQQPAASPVAAPAQISAPLDPFAAWRALPPDVRAKLTGFLGSAYQPAEMQAAALVLEAVAAGAGSAPPASALELVKAIDDLVGGAHAGVQQLRRVLGGG
jgi:hypothetical protein